MVSAEDIKTLVASGEGYHAEFKVAVPSKVRELASEVCAFANADGGVVLIGVNDQNIITGTSIDNSKRSAIQNSISEITPTLYCPLSIVEVDGKMVGIIEVPSGPNKPYVLSGAIYLREGANSQKLTTSEEMRDFFQQSDRIYFDSIPDPKFDIYSELDPDNFHDFRREAQLSNTISNQQILENLQLFDKNGIIKRGGILFFAKKPEEQFFQAIVRCVLFKGTTKVHIIDDKTFGGTLYRQYQQAIAWIESKLQVSYLIEGSGPRIEIWEIPLTVFKEAIINALSHRDYYEQGAVITIEMFDDRVEVSNPGGLLLGVVKDFGHKSMSRNPLVFSLFTRMHLVERIASGIPRMREAMKEANLPEPVFHTDGMFTVIFERPQKDIKGTGQSSKTLSERQTRIVQMMNKNDKVTYEEIIAELHLSPTTLNKDIQFLKELGVIERVGSARNGKWRVSLEV
jgi:ATP-dependent DNA helicase RecG